MTIDSEPASYLANHYYTQSPINLPQRMDLNNNLAANLLGNPIENDPPIYFMDFVNEEEAQPLPENHASDTSDSPIGYNLLGQLMQDADSDKAPSVVSYHSSGHSHGDLAMDDDQLRELQGPLFPCLVPETPEKKYHQLMLRYIKVEQQFDFLDTREAQVMDGLKCGLAFRTEGEYFILQYIFRWNVKIVLISTCLSWTTNGHYYGSPSHG